LVISIYSCLSASFHTRRF